MGKTYKVWVEIEELGDDGEPTKNDLGILPDSLGTFDRLEDAVGQVAQVVEAFGIDPENSDSVKGIPATDCRKCGTPLDGDGYCGDETCPYSDHKQDETWTEG